MIPTMILVFLMFIFSSHFLFALSNSWRMASISFTEWAIIIISSATRRRLSFCPLILIPFVQSLVLKMFSKQDMNNFGDMVSLSLFCCCLCADKELWSYLYRCLLLIWCSCCWDIVCVLARARTRKIYTYMQCLY